MTPDQLALLEPLTRLQRAVVTNLVAGMTQRQAYRAAGGTAKNDTTADTCVSTMLSNAKVRAALEGLQQAAVTSAVMRRAEALEMLSRIARTPLSALVDFEKVPVKVDEETGEVLATQTVWNIRDSAQQDPAALALISELEVGKHGPKIKTHSQMQALQQLAKIQGWEAPTKVAQTDSAGNDVDPASAGLAVLDALARKHALDR